MSVEQMAKATRGLPEFQELSKKMSQHVRLSQECMDKVLPPFFVYIYEYDIESTRCATPLFVVSGRKKQQKMIYGYTVHGPLAALLQQQLVVL